MNRRVSTIDLPPSNLPDNVSDYNLSLEVNGATVELPYKAKTPLDVGSIALREVIQYDSPATEDPERGEGSHFIEKPDNDSDAVPLESPAGTEIDGDTANKLSGLRRESLEGRQGPAYNNTDTIHTDQEHIARYQDWVRGTGRMLDVAWDEGVITDENLKEWMDFKQKVEKFHGITDFYALSDIGTLRNEVFQYVRKLGVADKAYAAYDAAAE